jgi:hypothetical protein
VWVVGEANATLCWGRPATHTWTDDSKQEVRSAGDKEIFV